MKKILKAVDGFSEYFNSVLNPVKFVKTYLRSCFRKAAPFMGRRSALNIFFTTLNGFSYL